MYAIFFFANFYNGSELKKESFYILLLLYTELHFYFIYYDG